MAENLTEAVPNSDASAKNISQSADAHRIPSLDGLRAVAVSFVLLSHTYMNDFGGATRHSKIVPAYGHFGVQIFFVISGFLITYLLQKERAKTGKINLWKFYRRRTFRILPASLFYIGVIALASRVMSLRIPARSFIYALTYTVSYTESKMPWTLGHLWSLSVEEQFYLLWPFVFALAFSFRKRFAWAVMFLSPVARTVCWKMGWHNTLYYFPTVADSIAAGCLLAIYLPQIRQRARIILSSKVLFTLLLCGTLVSPIYFAFHPQMNKFFSGLIPCLIALSVLVTIERRDRFLNNRIMEFIGIMSYSLYLWQQPFLAPTLRGVWNRFPLNLCLAFLCAYLSYRFIEKPMLRFKEKR